jgi:acyl dehydratase
MVDKSAIGHEAEPYDMVVERGKIREFARATMSRNPDYFDDPVAVSPPTFLMTSAFWSTSGGPTQTLNIDFARLLHGGQEFTFHGPPPRAGTKLTARGRVADIYEKEGKRGGTMQFIEVVTDFSDESGNVVAEAKSVLIITGQAPPTEVK